MHFLDDLYERCRGDGYLIAPGRSTSTREEPNRHLIISRHAARLGHFSRLQLTHPNANRTT